MIYYSIVTPKGNSSYSYDSQEDAEAKAKYLDDHGCAYCSRCSCCACCSGCSDCSYCSFCSDCSRCSHCSGCSDCSDCSRCSRCADCSGCSYCSEVKDGSKGVIQAGQPNSWPCYGYLKDDVLLIHCGCHKGERAKTLASAVAYWSNKPDRLEVLMACHYIASVAHSRGWRTE